MGRSILEHIGLSLKYVSPEVPAVFYSRCLLVVPACVQDTMTADWWDREVLDFFASVIVIFLYSAGSQMEHAEVDISSPY